MLLAHGVGSRTDLPIPLGLALYGGGFAILISFGVLLLFWRRPTLGDASSGRPVPAWLQRFADSQGVRLALQALALLVAAFVLAAALAGPRDTSRNLAPWALYVTFWVGLVPASLLLGPVWRGGHPPRALRPAPPGPRAAGRAAATGRAVAR